MTIAYQIKQYNTAQEFLKETEIILEKDVILNNFPLWASTDLAMVKNNPYPQYYSSVWKNDELVYVFTCVNNIMYVGWCGHDRQQDYNQLPSDLYTPELQLVFRSILKNCYQKLGNTLQCIFGYTPLSFYIYEQWKLLTIPIYNNNNHNHKSIILMDQHPTNFLVWCFELKASNLLILKETTQKLLPKTYLRLATMDDLDLLTEWMKQFMIDSNIPLTYFEQDARDYSHYYIKNKNAYLWCDQITNQPLGTIWKRNSIKRLVITLSSVFIPKEYRSQGFAAAMVTQFSLYLFNEYQYQSLTLLMDGNRDPLNNLYASIGYHPIGSFARLCL